MLSTREFDAMGGEVVGVDDLCADEQLVEWFFSDDRIDTPTRQFGPQPPARRTSRQANGERYGFRLSLAPVVLATLVLVIAISTVFALTARSQILALGEAVHSIDAPAG